MTERGAHASAGGAILLYDGTCGFCARSVQFVFDREGPRRSLRFARLDGEFGRRVAGHGADRDSVVWHEPARESMPARMLVRSDATIAVLRYLGGAWALFGVMLAAVPRFIRDACYNFIARHRHRIHGRGICVIPRADHRSRFLDPDA